MHIYILGIGEPFMSGVAILARQLGHQVTGCDANINSLVSANLKRQGIEIINDYDSGQLASTPDMVLMGSRIRRGNPCVEYVLDRNLPYTSGPKWLQEFLLQDRWVMAVIGRQGKATTASMLALVLENCGYSPGYLFGTVSENTEISAQLGESMFFVIEADEYESAFFDMRSKFVHYRPRTLLVSNQVFDSADSLNDVKAIQRHLHQLVSTVPSHGRIFASKGNDLITQTLERGYWSELEYIGEDGHWQATKRLADGSHFEVYFNGDRVGEVEWELVGDHHVRNGLMVIAAARHVGVVPALACESLAGFSSRKEE